MKHKMEASILEQLRLQEGRLFQNERVLALYLDAKAVILDCIAEVDDCDELVKTLEILSPQGLKDYHAKSLYEVCKVVAKLLWPTQMLLVARPKTSTLLRGLKKRLLASEPFRLKSFQDLDPIKQDFVVREAFRRTVVNDCLVIFDTEDGQVDDESEAEAPEAPELPETAEDVGPDDSASQAPKRPAGARSTLGPIHEDDSIHDGESTVQSLVKVHRSARDSSSVMDRSIAPRVITVATRDGDSAASKATGLTSSTVMRKPFNVRKIVLEPDAQ